MRKLTEEEIEESIRFGNAGLAAAGHFFNDEEADDDLRAALRGELTSDEVVARIVARASSRVAK